MPWSITSVPGKTLTKIDGKRGDLLAIRIETKQNGASQGLFARLDSPPIWVDIDRLEEVRVVDPRPRTS